MDDEAFSPSGFDSISTEQSAPPAIEPATYSDSSTNQVLNGDAYSNSNDNPSYNHSDSYNNYVTQDFSTPTHSLTPEYVDHNNSYISGNDGSNTSDMYGDGSIPSYNTSTPDINEGSYVSSLDSHESSGVFGETSDVHDTPINFGQDTGITPEDASTLPELNYGGSQDVGINSDGSSHQILNGEAYSNSNDNPSYNHSDSYNNYGTQNSSTSDHSLTPETPDHVDVHNNSYISSNDDSNTPSTYGDGSIPSSNTSTPDTNAESNVPSFDSRESSGIGGETSDVHETPIHDINSEQDTGITPLDASTLPEPNYVGSNDLGNGIDLSTSHENTNDGEDQIHEPRPDKEYIETESNIPSIDSPNSSDIDHKLSNHQEPYIDTASKLGSIDTPTDIANNPASTSETNANGISLRDVTEVVKAFNFGTVAGGSIDFLQSIAHSPNNLMKAIEVGSLGAMQMARYELGYTFTEKMFENFLGENDKNDINVETIRSAIQGCVGGVAATFSIAGCATGAFYETILTTGKYGLDALSDSTGSEWLKPYAYGAAGLGAGILTHKIDPSPFLKWSYGAGTAIYEQTRDGLFPDNKPINNNGEK